MSDLSYSERVEAVKNRALKLSERKQAMLAFGLLGALKTSALLLADGTALTTEREVRTTVLTAELLVSHLEEQP